MPAEEHKIVGDILRQQSKRYTVRYNPNTNCWHLLDLWHESLQTLNPESPIPEDSPAMTVLPADAFNILMAEADRVGIIGRIFGPGIGVVESEKAPDELEEKPLGKSMQPGADATFEDLVQQVQEETRRRDVPDPAPMEAPQQSRPDSNKEFYNFKLRQQALELIREITVPLHVSGMID